MSNYKLGRLRVSELLSTNLTSRMNDEVRENFIHHLFVVRKQFDKKGNDTNHRLLLISFLCVSCVRNRSIQCCFVSNLKLKLRALVFSGERMLKIILLFMTCVMK